MSGAARQTLRNFAAWANKLDAQQSIHTPVVVGAEIASCFGSYAIQAVIQKDSAYLPELLGGNCGVSALPHRGEPNATAVATYVRPFRSQTPTSML